MLTLIFMTCLAGENGLYGAKIKTDTPLVSITELMANPETYMDKMVRVKGTVATVCPKAGCWVDIADNGEKVRIKVKDGEIVFDKDLVGKSVIAEGTVYKFELTHEKAVGYFRHLAEELGEPFDESSVTSGTTIYQIGGLGLQIDK